MNLDLRNNEGGSTVNHLLLSRLQKGPTSSVRATICLGVRVFVKAALLFPKSVFISVLLSLTWEQQAVGLSWFSEAQTQVQGFCFSEDPLSPGTEPWHRAPGCTPPLPTESISHSARSQAAAGCIRIAGHSLPI